LSARDAQSVLLSDGSRVDLGSDVVLLARENSGDAVRLEMSAGRATFDVRPHGPRLWSIDCGEFLVEVLGTRFTIEHQGAWGEVQVARGVVRVSGPSVPGGSRTLRAGESLRMPEQEPAAVPAIAPMVEQRPRATPGWRELATRGEYDAAYASVMRTGIEREAQRSHEVETLFALADTARLSGHPADARYPLERIVQEHPTDRRAPLAAFTLGRIELESMQRREIAAQWFERAIALGLSGSLRTAAERRIAEIRAR
jgi:transmembrane sensor